MTIFEDVFVPKERIFMDGEWEFAGALANCFATWHRFTGISYKYPFAEMMIGVAALVGRLQRGPEGFPHPGQDHGSRRSMPSP